MGDVARVRSYKTVALIEKTEFLGWLKVQLLLQVLAGTAA